MSEFNFPFSPGTLVEEAGDGALRAVDPRQADFTRAMLGASPTPATPVEPPRIPPPVETPEDAATAEKKDEVFCPNCGYRVSTDEIVPTDEDKLLFQAAMLGLGDTRFKRSASLYGGAVQVTFQAALTVDTQAIAQQMSKDVRDGVVVSAADYQLQLGRYGLAAGVAEIVAGGSRRIMPSLAETAKTHPTSSVAEITTWFETQVAPTESLRTTVAREHVKFQMLSRYLEGKANDDLFWRRTGGPSS